MNWIIPTKTEKDFIEWQKHLKDSICYSLGISKEMLDKDYIKDKKS